MPSTGTYTLSLHDALPIFGALLRRSQRPSRLRRGRRRDGAAHLRRIDRTVFADRRSQVGRILVVRDIRASDPLAVDVALEAMIDRKSTRLNSSHSQISYAVDRDLHSFPTRRSSDLRRAAAAKSTPKPIAPRPPPRWRRAPAPHRPHRIRRPAFPSRKDSRCPRYPRQRSIGRRCSFGSDDRSEEHTSELQSQSNLVCRRPGLTLFPYTTLFRSSARCCGEVNAQADCAAAAAAMAPRTCAASTAPYSPTGVPKSEGFSLSAISAPAIHWPSM